MNTFLDFIFKSVKAEEKLDFSFKANKQITASKLTMKENELENTFSNK